MALSKSEVLVQRICRSLRRTDNEFALFFVVVNLPVARRELAREVRECFAQPVVELAVPAEGFSEETLDGWLLPQLEEAAQDAVVFLYDLDRMLPAENKPLLHFLQQVNWRRSALAAIKRPLVIWLPRFALDKLAEYAPDFYDWYSNVYELASPAEELAQISDGFKAEFGTEVHPAERLSRAEKQEWLHTLTALLDEHPESNGYRARLLNDLGGMHNTIGNLDDALELYEQSLEVWQQVDDKIGIGRTFCNISQIYHDKNELDTALRYLEKALAIQQEAGDNLGESVTLNNMSQIYKIRGNFDSALELLKTTLEIKVETGDGVGSGCVLNNIAQIYMAKGDDDIALKFLEQSLNINENIGNESGIGVVLNNISQIYKAKGDLDIASEYLKNALKIQQEIGDRANEGLFLNNLAGLYEEPGRYTEAESLYQQALAIMKDIFPAGNPDLATVQANYDRVKRILAER